MDIISRSFQQEQFNKLGLALPTESRADEIYEKTRSRAKASLYFFSTAILQWNRLRPVPHLELCNFIQQVPPEYPDRKRRKVVLIPRDTYKSTVGSKSLPLWILIQDSFCGIPGPEHRILLTSYAGTNASKHIKSIQQQIERNDMLRWFFPEIIPDLSRTTWTATNLLFPRSGMYGEDTIEAAGVDSHIVSRHYTVQIKDDIEDKEAAESPTVRQKVKDTYKSWESLFVDEREAYDLIIGTRWGSDDVYADIMANESEAYEFLVRPLHWTREDLIEDQKNAEEHQKPTVYHMDPDVFAPDPDEIYYFFPEIFPEDSCRRIRAKQGQWMYSMLYLNNPKDPSLAEFSPQSLLFWIYDDLGNIILENARGETEYIQFDSLKRVLFWDPAMDTRSVQNNCRNAMIVAFKDHKDRIFISDAWAKRTDPTLQLHRYIGFHQKRLVHKAAIEDASFQRVLKFPLYQVQRELQYHFPVLEQKPIGDKDARIRSLIPYNESHLLCVRRGMELQDFLDELKGFPVFPTKDLLDAAAACIELFGAAAVANPRQQRQGNLREAVANASRSSVTGY